ncbi:response regulator transcription factor [Paraburkholderia rhizosphaerae]|nr:response regulator transcription factor [Paraburkholderia rhizosphaerae]
MRKQTRVVLVEDDAIQQSLLVSWLKAEGYHVDAFDNGLDARNYLSDHWADLMILDWDVPGISGDRLLTWVRGRSRSTVPVIFQTVHSNEEDIVRILDTGADDFLIKPFDKMVLLARIRALLRRFHNAASDSRQMIVGRYVLDRANLSIAGDDVVQRLGTKEFDLLWHLASHCGTVVQRQDLHSVVWGWDGGATSRSVDMYVSRLRANLKAIGIEWTIQSVYAKGYRLNMSDDGPAVVDAVPHRNSNSAAALL